MLKINIDVKKLQEMGISLNEVLLVIRIKYPEILFTFTPITFKNALDKELIKLGGSTATLTDRGEELVRMFSDNMEDSIAELAATLRELFPEGKKGGIYYWRGSLSEIEKKLISFFKRHGTKYSIEDIEIATKRYVDSFDDRNRDRAMMLLKYFIEKNGTSTLLSYLEHIEEAKQLSIDYGNSVEL